MSIDFAHLVPGNTIEIKHKMRGKQKGELQLIKGRCRSFPCGIETDTGIKCQACLYIILEATLTTTQICSPYILSLINLSQNKINKVMEI